MRRWYGECYSKLDQHDDALEWQRKFLDTARLGAKAYVVICCGTLVVLLLVLS